MAIRTSISSKSVEFGLYGGGGYQQSVCDGIKYNKLLSGGQGAFYGLSLSHLGLKIFGTFLTFLLVQHFYNKIGLRPEGV